ncbi:hypothetical protein BH09PLA1_BH09PLA1_34740 [soil metagenome]
MERMWYRVAMMVLAASSVARAEIRYSVTDLGDLGQHYALPSAVSDTGGVAGQSSVPDNQNKAFYWRAGTGMIDLVPPGEPGTRPEGVAYGVNDAGQVVGYVRHRR